MCGPRAPVVVAVNDVKSEVVTVVGGVFQRPDSRALTPPPWNLEKRVTKAHNEASDPSPALWAHGQGHGRVIPVTFASFSVDPPHFHDIEPTTLSTAAVSISSPASMSPSLVSSRSLWEIPSTLGTNSMTVGTVSFMFVESCPATVWTSR